MTTLRAMTRTPMAWTWRSQSRQRRARRCASKLQGLGGRGQQTPSAAYAAPAPITQVPKWADTPKRKPLPKPQFDVSVDEQHKYVWEVNDVATGVTYPGKRNRRAMKEYFKTRAITSFPGWKVSCKGGDQQHLLHDRTPPIPLVYVPAAGGARHLAQPPPQAEGRQVAATAQGAGGQEVQAARVSVGAVGAVPGWRVKSTQQRAQPQHLLLMQMCDAGSPPRRQRQRRRSQAAQATGGGQHSAHSSSSRGRREGRGRGRRRQGQGSNRGSLQLQLRHAPGEGASAGARLRLKLMLCQSRYAASRTSGRRRRGAS